MTGKNDRQTFAGLLRETRQAAGLTQEELSLESGLSVRAISALERGSTVRPHSRSVSLLADALHVTQRVRAEMREAARRHGRMSAPADPGDVESAAPAPQPEMVPHQLPGGVADFTGRQSEISELTTALAPGSQRNAVTTAVICGQPGVGKTSLALQVAHMLRPAFPDGQLWVSLTGASSRPRDCGEMLGELLRALGIAGSAVPSGTAERVAFYRSRLADQRILIVADDAGSSAQVQPLLPGTAGSAVLVTSRTQLAGLAGARLRVLDPFSPQEAIRLLTRMVGEERVHAEPGAAAEVVDACGLMPLAVRIAGARLATRPSWPVSLLARAMRGERRLLDELEVEDMSVRVSVSLSYGTLGAQAQRAFRLLGLLGPQDVADWVIAALLGQPDVNAVVNELVGKSLLTPVGVDSTGQARYRLHDLLCEYACERLAEEPRKQQDAALHRALTAWLQLAGQASQGLQGNPFFPPVAQRQADSVIDHELARRLTAEPLSWFNAERLNLLTAVHNALKHDRVDLAIGLGISQGDFQYLHNRTDESVQMWQQIEHAARSLGEKTRAVIAGIRYAAALVIGGKSADAANIIDPCIDELAHGDDALTLAFALYWRAAVRYNLHDFHAALDDSRRGLALAQQAGNQHAEFLNLRMAGQSLAYLGRATEGIEACERGVLLAGELGQSYHATARQALAYTYVLVRKYDHAVPLCISLIEMNRSTGNVWGEGQALGLLGDAYHGLGRYRKAVAALSEALHIFRAHSNRRHHGLCLLKLGYAYHGLGRNREAASRLKESIAVFQELRLPYYEQRARAALAECSAGSGKQPGSVSADWSVADQGTTGLS